MHSMAELNAFVAYSAGDIIPCPYHQADHRLRLDYRNATTVSLESTVLTAVNASFLTLI